MQQAGALQQIASEPSSELGQARFSGVPRPVRQRISAMSPDFSKAVTFAAAPSPPRTSVDRRIKPVAARKVLQRQATGTAVLDPPRIGDELGSRSNTVQTLLQLGGADRFTPR